MTVAVKVKILPWGDGLAEVPSAVVVADPDGNLLYANSYAVALFGFPEGIECGAQFSFGRHGTLTSDRLFAASCSALIRS